MAADLPPNEHSLSCIKHADFPWHETMSSLPSIFNQFLSFIVFPNTRRRRGRTLSLGVVALPQVVLIYILEDAAHSASPDFTTHPGTVRLIRGKYSLEIHQRFSFLFNPGKKANLKHKRSYRRRHRPRVRMTL